MRMKLSLRTAFGALAVVLACAACSTPEYRAWEGDAKIYRGSGGTKDIVDGVEIWQEGQPARRFWLVGVITDTRADDALRRSMLRSAVAAQVKKVGGDGAILLSNQAKESGAIYLPQPSGQGLIVNSTEVTRRYAVIKYVPDHP